MIIEHLPKAENRKNIFLKTIYLITFELILLVLLNNLINPNQDEIHKRGEFVFIKVKL